MYLHRLSNQSIVAIEHEILDNLEIKQIVANFAKLKVRKVQFI